MTRLENAKKSLFFIESNINYNKYLKLHADGALRWLAAVMHFLRNQVIV